MPGSGSTEICHAAIDALPHRIAILDSTGRIIGVNESWKTAASVNGLRSPDFGVGTNYLDICNRSALAGVPQAALAADGITSVLSGTRKEYHLDYLCEGPVESQWYALRVFPYDRGGFRGAVVYHEECTERMLAQTEASSSSQLSRALVESAVDGIVIIDGMGHIRDLNAACQRMFEYGPTELLGKNVRVLMPSPYRQEHDGYIRRYLNTGEARIIGTTRELVACTKSGRLFPIELSVSEFTAGGQKMFTGVIRDLSDRRRVEERLRETLLQFENVFEAADEGYVLTREDGLILNLNPAASELLGISRETIGHVRIADVLPAAASAPAVAAGIPVSAADTRYLEVTALDGQPRQLAVTVKRNVSLGRHVWKITDAAPSSDEQNQKLRTAFRNAAFLQDVPVGVSIIDIDGLILEGNTRFGEMLGYTATELSGRRLTEVTHPEDVIETADTLDRLVRGGVDSITFEKRFLHTNGGIVWARVTASLARSVTGKPQFLILMAEDLTNFRRISVSAGFMKKAFQDSPVPSALLTPEGRVVDSNTAFQRIAGQGALEISGRTIDRIFAVAGESTLSDGLEVVRTGNLPYAVLPVRRLNGDPVAGWSRAVFSMLHGENRWSDMVLCNLLDITGSGLAGALRAGIIEDGHAILDSLPCGIQEWKLDGTIVYANASRAHLNGCTPGELIGRKLWDFAGSGAERESLRRMFSKILDERPSPVPFEIWDHSGGGQKKRLHVDWDYRRDLTGRLTGLVAVISDVTGRINVESEMRSMEAILGLMATNMPGALYRCEADDEYRCLFLGSQVEQITGYPRSEFMAGGGRPFGSIIHPDDAGRVGAEISRSIQSGRHFDIIYRIWHRDGSIRWVRDVGRGFREADGNVRWLDGIFTDVTVEWRRDNAMRALSELTGNKVGAEFFQTLTRQLSEIFGYQVAFVGRVLDSTGEELETLAMWDRGCPASPFNYSASGTPCELLKFRDEVCLPTQLQTLFPGDEWVRTHGLDSYAAIRLIDSDGRYVGMLGVLDDRPIDSPVEVLSILRLFGARASAEIFRIGAEENLRRSHEDLQLAVEEQTRELLSANENLKRLVQISREAQKNLRIKDQALETSVNAIAMGDLNGTLTYVNRAFLRLWGYTDVSEVIGRRATEFWKSPDEAQNVIQVLGEKGGWIGEMVALRKDGTMTDVHLTAHLVRDDDGTPICMMGSFVDITLQKTATERLRESEERYRSVVSALDEGIVYLDYSGRIITSNRKAGEILGLAPEEVDGRTPLDPRWKAIRENGDPFPGEEHPSWIALKTGIPQSDVVMGIETGDGGEIRWLRIGAQPVFRPGVESPYAVVVTFRDITAERDAERTRKELQHQLHQAQKLEAVGRLAGGLAHDFSNLLGAISGNAQLLRMDTDPSQRQWKDLTSILDTAQSAARLTRQLLSFSRPMAITPEVMPVAAAVERNVELLRRLIRENVGITVSARHESGHIRADRSQLEQVLVNLAINAADAMPTGGDLVIEVSPAGAEHLALMPGADSEGGRYAAIRVKDTGHGMTAEVRERIFEPFFTTKEMGKGSGLGLYSVYGIIRSMGGMIHVWSEPGKGSCFTILLPLVEDRPREAEGRHAADLRGDEVILLVEDQEQLRGVTGRFLQRLGYTVYDAPDGAAAEAFLASHSGRVDMVVTDVVMPNLNGRMLAERIKRLRPGTRVLFVTGYDAEIIKKHGLSAGQFDLLMKPYDLEQLAQKIREILDN